MLEGESASYHGSGTCTFYGTANSNQMLMEVMGLHLPGSAFITPGTPLRDALIPAQLKLLPLDAEAIKTLTAGDSVLMPLDIAAGTYPNQQERIPTVGVAALMLTTTDLTRDEALVVVRAVYQAGQDLLAAGSTQGSQVSAATARLGLSVPLHDGAEEGIAQLEHGKPR